MPLPVSAYDIGNITNYHMNKDMSYIYTQIWIYMLICVCHNYVWCLISEVGKYKETTIRC